MTNNEAEALFLQAMSEVRARKDTPEHISLHYQVWDALVSKDLLDINLWEQKSSYLGIPVHVDIRHVKDYHPVRVSSKEDRLLVEELNRCADLALRDTLCLPTGFTLGSKVVERFQRHLGTLSLRFRGVPVEIDPHDSNGISFALKEDPPEWCNLNVYVARLDNDARWGTVTGFKGATAFIRLEEEDESEINVSFGDLMREWHKIPPRVVAKDRFRRVLSLDTVSDHMKR